MATDKRTFWQRFKEKWWDFKDRVRHYNDMYQGMIWRFEKPPKPSKDMLAVPKCMLRTPANYMPAGTVMYNGHNYPAVWLNGTRHAMVGGAERYRPPIYDDQGNMIEPPFVEPRHDLTANAIGTVAEGLATAAAGYAAYKAGEAGGFRRGAQAGYQLGRFQGADLAVNHLHIEPID